ncbi:MAG: ligase-associated DNA damage response endonuclease PdeM [Granulosicoccus sp.]|nr:ligase-associated DNA damage response endonuclease PdeM [Granulosicoccus sp.]
MTAFDALSLKIRLAGEEICLHPECAMYWPARRVLFVADVHLGKEHSFGRQGFAIPGGISEDTLASLFSLCDMAQAHTLVVLGDFMHCAPRADESWLAALVDMLALRPGLAMHIVAGNHDKAEGRLLTDKRIHWHHQSLAMEPFVLQHEPGRDARAYVLSGHLHPVWHLGGGRRSTLRAPAFWIRPDHAVLPAFGHFTGGLGISADYQHDRVYVAGDDCVVRIPLSRPRQRSRRAVPDR